MHQNHLNGLKSPEDYNLIIRSGVFKSCFILKHSLLALLLMCSQVWGPPSIPIICSPPESKQESVDTLEQMSTWGSGRLGGGRVLEPSERAHPPPGLLSSRALQQAREGSGEIRPVCASRFPLILFYYY